MPGCIFLGKVQIFRKEVQTGLIDPLIGIETGVQVNLPFRFPEHDNWLEKAIRIDKKNTVCTCSFRFEEGVLPCILKVSDCQRSKTKLFFFGKGEKMSEEKELTLGP